jgi:hypothetical protein
MRRLTAIKACDMYFRRGDLTDRLAATLNKR